MQETDETRPRWPSNLCYAVAGLFGVAGIFFASYGYLFAVAANAFWALVIAGAGLLLGVLSGTQHRALARILSKAERMARHSAPVVGTGLGFAFALVAWVMLSTGEPFLGLINAFWAAALPVVGFLWKRMGFARTAALSALTAGLAFLIAATVMYEYRETMFVWINVFWGGILITTGYVIDARRKLGAKG